MTDEQWILLLSVLEGKKHDPLPVGFIIDSPWLPGWYGASAIDYFTSDQVWMDANLKAVNTFPGVMFLPGFWAEYGMCTEPSGFGSKTIWAEEGLPHAEKIIKDMVDIKGINKPDVKSDGLLPFVIKRLQHCQDDIRKNGHEIRFAVAKSTLKNLNSVPVLSC